MKATITHWNHGSFQERHAFGLGPIYMPFLCNMAPPHLDFLRRNDDTKVREQAGSPVKLTLGDRPTDIRGNPAKEQGMLDVVLLAGGIGFFILSIAYAYGCDRL
jgi:hypothetical protein